MKTPFIVIICILLFILWIYSSISKIAELTKFKEAMATQVFPKFIGKILVILLPAFEFVLALSLLFQESRLLGMYASFTLMLLFTLYVGGAVYNIYERYPCACGGLFAKLGWKSHFKVNIFFTLVALAGILLLEAPY